MPRLLLIVGCFALIISVLSLYSPLLNLFDLASVEWMSQHRIAVFNQITTAFSALGGMPFVLFFTTLWCLHLAWYKKYSEIVFISIGIFGSISIVWLLKFTFTRPRPPEMYHLVASYGSSFPSAHSCYAAALACLMILVYRQHTHHKLIALFAFIWMLCMGISRVYVGVHFPTDVLSGWSISLIWIALLYLITIKFSKA
ncbi:MULTISPECIES: phosphatase PAP2 family protein [unclassified Acinetobacter]|uniref:phosphatase PAP2 family protein n=1 Tax=unclassified Acinetobacter TaxID=196816 RepID=UPI0015D385AA|nr:MULTISPECIES: phosphatase PAP2 family protein [unclassified Acinetobacter]